MTYMNNLKKETKSQLAIEASKTNKATEAPKKSTVSKALNFEEYTPNIEKYLKKNRRRHS